MAPAPLVSFVVPCFNHGAYLDEAIDSVFAQTVQDFDIVIVNDGSTDEATTRLLAAYQRPRTRVVTTANRGLPAARNTGIAETTGRFLCMLDADDRLEPRYLERSLGAFDADPELAFVSHWFRAFGDQSWEWTPTDCSLATLLSANTLNGAALVRRTVVEAVGGFDESMRDGCEDWDFWIAATRLGFRGRILHEFLFWYRRRPDSMSRTMLRGGGESRLYRQLLEKHVESAREVLPELVAEGEPDWATTLQGIEDLELGLYDWTEPELRRLQDETGTLPRQALHGEIADRRQEALRPLTPLALARQKALEYHADASRANLALDEMRRSASWRVTAPLRAAWTVIRHLTGRTS